MENAAPIHGVTAKETKSPEKTCFVQKKTVKQSAFVVKLDLLAALALLVDLVDPVVLVVVALPDQAVCLHPVVIQEVSQVDLEALAAREDQLVQEDLLHPAHLVDQRSNIPANDNPTELNVKTDDLLSLLCVTT